MALIKLRKHLAMSFTHTGLTLYLSFSEAEAMTCWLRVCSPQHL